MTILQRLIGLWRQRFPKKDTSLPTEVQWAETFIENASVAVSEKELLALIEGEVEHGFVTIPGWAFRGSALIIEAVTVGTSLYLYPMPEKLGTALFSISYSVFWLLRILFVQTNIMQGKDNKEDDAVGAFGFLRFVVLAIGGVFSPGVWLSLACYIEPNIIRSINNDKYPLYRKKIIVPPTFARFREQYAKAIDIKKTHMLGILDDLTTRLEKKQNNLDENEKRLMAHEKTLKHSRKQTPAIGDEQTEVVDKTVQELRDARKKINATLTETKDYRGKIAGIYAFLGDYVQEDGLLVALHDAQKVLEGVDDLRSEANNLLIESLGKLSLDLRKMESTLLTLRNEDALALPSGLSESILGLEAQMMHVGTQQAV